MKYKVIIFCKKQTINLIGLEYLKESHQLFHKIFVYYFVQSVVALKWLQWLLTTILQNNPAK